MDKELVAHIVELVKMELRNSADADVASSATGMLRLELVVHQCLMEMGRQVVQDLAQQAGTGYQGRRVKRGKVVFRFKGNRAKTVHGLYGPVTVERAYYYASGSGETWVPLDEQLGIGDGQCTDGTVLRLRRPSQPQLEHRKIYRALRIPATPPPRGGRRL